MKKSEGHQARLIIRGQPVDVYRNEAGVVKFDSDGLEVVLPKGTGRQTLDLITMLSMVSDSDVEVEEDDDDE